MAHTTGVLSKMTLSKYIVLFKIVSELFEVNDLCKRFSWNPCFQFLCSYLRFNDRRKLSTDGW